jgi:peptidoglycan/LPS O-acetylase OafA/YrhL
LEFWKKITERLLEDTSTSGTKFSPLDGLRGIAVLVVFLSHSSGFRQRLTPWTSFHGTGHLGVYLFFVLSGFLLTWSLLAAPRINFTGFYLRRFFRIAPLFYLIVSAVFAWQLWSGRVDLFNLHVKEGWTGYLQHLAFYRGDSVFWTIAAEFEFYVILPFLVAALARGGAKIAALYAVVAAAAGVWYILIEFGKVDPRYSLKIANIVHHSQYLDVFLYGIIAAWFFQRPGFVEQARAHRAFHSATTAALVVVIVLSLILVAENFFGLGRFWRNEQSWWKALDAPARFGPQSWSIFYGPAFAIIALASLTGHRFLTAVCNLRILRLIGVTGFSWYMIHFPILRMVNALFGFAPTAGGKVEWTFREPAALFVSFVITSAAAIALYLAVEKPFMILSRNLLRKPKPVAV